MGRAMLNLILIFAQMYRESASENTRAANHRRAKDGLWVGGRTPMGYVRDGETKKLRVVEKEAELVRLVFNRALELSSALRTAKWLNGQGHRHRNGKKFSHDAVLRILKNRLYRGVIVYDGAVYEGQHDAIVDSEAFARAESMLDANNHRQYRAPEDREHDYLLTGLVCDSTGAAMIAKPGRSQTGKLYPYYESSGLRKQIDHKCEVKRLRAEHLEDAVVSVIRELATDSAAIAEGVEEANRLSRSRADPLRAEARGLRVELASVKDGAERLLDTIVEAGIESSTTARRRLREAEARQAEIEARLMSLRSELAELDGQEVDVETVQSMLIGFDGAWDRLTVAERREVLELLVDRIVVKKDEIILDLYDGSGAKVLREPEKANPRSRLGGKNRGFVSDLVWLRRRDSNSRPGG
ncbi:MAG: recombinase family protein [Nannocystaceae bacterium]|nr:recombinase family protein [Nannocystaceae bacterium]